MVGKQTAKSGRNPGKRVALSGVSTTASRVPGPHTFAAASREAVREFFRLAVEAGAEALHEPRLGPQYHFEAAPSGPRLSITLTNRQVTNPVIVSYQAHPGLVRENRELVTGADGQPPARSVRHIEIGLPSGMTYQTGDHLGGLPRNSSDSVRRVMAHFGLDAGQYITIIPNSGSHTHLPIEEPTPLLGVLGSCVELQDVASRDDLAVLAQYAEDPGEKAALEAMAGDDDQAHAAYRERVYDPNHSVLDLLEEFSSCRLPFEGYLDLAAPATSPLLLDLLFVPGEPRRLQHHHRGAAGTGTVR